MKGRRRDFYTYRGHSRKKTISLCAVKVYRTKKACPVVGPRRCGAKHFLLSGPRESCFGAESPGFVQSGAGRRRGINRLCSRSKLLTLRSRRSRISPSSQVDLRWQLCEARLKKGVDKVSLVVRLKPGCLKPRVANRRRPWRPRRPRIHHRNQRLPILVFAASIEESNATGGSHAALAPSTMPNVFFVYRRLRGRERSEYRKRFWSIA